MLTGINMHTIHKNKYTAIISEQLNLIVEGRGRGGKESVPVVPNLPLHHWIYWSKIVDLNLIYLFILFKNFTVE